MLPLFLPGGGQGHRPALGEPWAGESLVGADTGSVRTRRSPRCQDGVRPSWHHDSSAVGITLAFPVSLPTSLYLTAAATHPSKFGAENMQTETRAAFSHPC